MHSNISICNNMMLLYMQLSHPHYITTTITSHAPYHAPPMHRPMHGPVCQTPYSQSDHPNLQASGLHDTAAIVKHNFHSSKSIAQLRTLQNKTNKYNLNLVRHRGQLFFLFFTNDRVRHQIIPNTLPCQSYLLYSWELNILKLKVIYLKFKNQVLTKLCLCMYRQSLIFLPITKILLAISMQIWTLLSSQENIQPTYQ